MNTDFECTLYVVKGLDGVQWLDIPLHVLRCIPISDNAVNDIVGCIEVCNRDMVLGKNDFAREIKAWNGKHHQLKIREHHVTEHNMLWHIVSLKKINFVRHINPHPFSVCEKELTFPQLVSYRLVQQREGQKVVKRSWSRDTLMLNVAYDTDGGITLGIEPDGYCHS